jgi:hypothetical protein
MRIEIASLTCKSLGENGVAPPPNPQLVPFVPRLRIPDDADQRSGMKPITIPF